MSNREDDGGQQWFDAKMRQRINERVQTKQGAQQNNRDGKSYLDRKVGGAQQSQAAEITDPYIRKLIEGRQQQQFFGPAHLGGKVVDKTTAGNYEIDVDMSAMEQSILRRQQEFQRLEGGPVSGVGEADMARLFGGNTNTQNNHQPHPLPGMRQPDQMNQHHQQPQGPQTVTLREGYPVYRCIQQSFGNTFVLAREVGTINSQLSSQQFIAKNPMNVYIVPQHQAQVNIQEIQNNPRLLTTLVEIQAPPLSSIGSLLVPQEALVGGRSNNQSNNQTRQLITDSRHHQQLPQQSRQPPQQQTTQYGVPFRRGLLKG